MPHVACGRFAMRSLGTIGLAVLLALLAIPNERARADGPAKATARPHKDFPSRYLENKRDITVYLPPGYETDKEKRYPVLYLQDSEARIKADETAERLITAGKIRPFILVWISNARQRFNELAYHPWPTMKTGGKGNLYGKCLAEEL